LATGHGERMKTNLNRIDVKDLNILSGLSPSSFVETVRIVYKSGGASAYLPRSILEFLGLRKGEDRSLLAILDDESEFNYVILVLDRDLVSLLKPIILDRRERAQQLQQKLKRQLQVQQSEEAITKTEEVIE